MAGIFSLENDDSFLNVTNEAKKRVNSNIVNAVTNNYLNMSYDKTTLVGNQSKLM